MERNTHLFAILHKEFRRVHAVCHCATNEGEPVENQRRFIASLEENLAGNIDRDGNEQKSSKEHQSLGDDALRAKLGNERVARSNLEDAHDCMYRDEAQGRFA